MKESERILNKFIKADITKYDSDARDYHLITIQTALDAVEMALKAPRKERKVAPPRRQRGHVPLVDFDDVCRTMNIDNDEELKSENSFEFMEAVKVILREKQFYDYIGGKRSFRCSNKRIKAVKDYFENSHWRKRNK